MSLGQLAVETIQGQERISTCLGCESGHVRAEVLDLGEPYLSGFVSEEEKEKCRRWPLKLVYCEDCRLAQLENPSPPDWHFRNYWYRSGITETMKKELCEIVFSARSIVGLYPGDRVVDIGANDGTLLRNYPQDVERIGFEPALNLQKEAAVGGNKIIPCYFDPAWIPAGSCKIVTAISMFYDLKNPLKFLQGVRHILALDGVFVLQMNYGGSMIENLAFDNIGHEHLAYYTMTPLLRLLDLAELHPFRAGLSQTNGGSIRLYIRRKDGRLGQGTFSDGSIDKILDWEQKNGIGTLDSWMKFAGEVRRTVERLNEMLWKEKQRGTEIWLYGASTRGSTLTQMLGNPQELFTAAAERDERKWGKITTGSWVPITSEESFRKSAGLGLVLPWHFRNEITLREKNYLQTGQLLFPLPHPEMVGRWA